MKLQQKLKSALCEFGHIPRVARFIHRPKVRSVLGKIRGVRAIYDAGWARMHPFDRLHGIETRITKDERDATTIQHASAPHAHSYAGTQVGPLRAVLRMLPNLETSTFIDLGCGKGRPLFVATEFPFREIIGVELSPQLAEVARRNAEAMALQFPQRTRVRVELRDAGDFELPPGNLVLFLYNPFGETIVARLAANIERGLTADAARSFYLIYCNPVFDQCFDACAPLIRVFRRAFPHEEQELGFGPGTADEVSLWRGGSAWNPADDAATN